LPRSPAAATPSTTGTKWSGFSFDANGSTAFYWKNNIITDLNTLIPANSPLHLLAAYSINDAGEITGQGCVMPACTELHAYRATPSK
jgi:hypothetical protein